MGEQLPDGDGALAVHRELGQVLGDRAVEPDPSGLHLLYGHQGREQLRQRGQIVDGVGTRGCPPVLRQLGLRGRVPRRVAGGTALDDLAVVDHQTGGTGEEVAGAARRVRPGGDLLLEGGDRGGSSPAALGEAGRSTVPAGANPAYGWSKRRPPPSVPAAADVAAVAPAGRARAATMADAAMSASTGIRMGTSLVRSWLRCAARLRPGRPPAGSRGRWAVRGRCRGHSARRRGGRAPGGRNSLTNSERCS